MKSVIGVSQNIGEDLKNVLRILERYGSERNVEEMKRFGIVSKAKILGVPKPVLRKIAKKISVNHELALKLWETNIHEARILASLIADPKKVDENLMEKWVRDFDNWDICDQRVFNLFWRTSLAYRKAVEWSLRSEEFVRRAGFVLMAKLAMSDKRANDSVFKNFLPYLLEGARDNRKYVVKAVSWALRRIGRRSPRLREKVLKLAEEIERIGTGNARYIARETIRELTKQKK